MNLRVAVVGMAHLHLFELVQGLLDAGAETVAHVPDGELLDVYEGWRPDSRPVELAELLADGNLDLIVTAGVPSERAAVALAALESGKHVLSVKPGVTTVDDLKRITHAVEASGRRWTVLFTERFTNRATSEAVRLARSGAIGEVVHVIGAGPHKLNLEGRPDWFFDPSASGGILVDLASHQVDQFLAITGELNATVSHSSIGNVACHEHPAFADVGTIRLAGTTTHGSPVIGDHRVDLLSPAGLGCWGDVRLAIIGTEGTLEARSNIDPAGAPGSEHLILVDRESTRRVDCSGVDVDWAGRLAADLVDGGARLMSQAHVLAVCDLTLTAQARANSWGAAQADARVTNASADIGTVRP